MTEVIQQMLVKTTERHSVIRRDLCGDAQTYCWGFCGVAAAEANVLAASLAFSEASFTVSLSSRWGASPATPESRTFKKAALDTFQTWIVKDTP